MGSHVVDKPPHKLYAIHRIVLLIFQLRTPLLDMDFPQARHELVIGVIFCTNTRIVINLILPPALMDQQLQIA